LRFAILADQEMGAGLGCLVHITLGQVLAKNERQLVVFDDVLNATDTGRLARVLALLEESADHLQIVILTCHPERYRALEEAKFFDLREKADYGLKVGG
jgi:uncharacterized protein YhaN